MADKKSNKLISEKSPYLLQHAHNPVNWFSWNEEAFKKSKDENKPIFLSIGYSTCHWCHVMEHESFEDPEVANLLNDVFISIKVDREERPDIDNIYMTVCQMMTGSGGWPLTIIMTPEKKPFFAGTYFPKESRYGRIGMLDLIPKIKELWTQKNKDVVNSANEVIGLLEQASKNISGDALTESELNAAYAGFLSRFDEEYGGFGEKPKFPTPHNLLFLLRYWKRTGHAKALHMVEKTLQAMRLGGIFDHIGFGFHRYSTDRHWLVPHFEKMLYDQALLAMAYTEVYQATKKEEYKKTANEIFEYVLRDMTSPLGGFYSAEDADSEGEEGKFYVWSEKEIREVLDNDADLFIKVFNIEKDGNHLEEATREKTGTNILHLKKLLVPNEEVQINKTRNKLFEVREKRIHPYKDDKILTDWNGLMIAALAKAAQAFNEPRYSEAAKKAFNFIQNKLLVNRKLLHRYRDGESAINANLDDYAFLIWGLIELYEATFDTDFLEIALVLNDNLIKHFWDEANGGFYFTRGDTKDILIRKKEIYDGAIPSGNSVAMVNLLLLYHMTENKKLEEYALKLERAFSNTIKDAPIAYTQFLIGVDFHLGPAHEIIISGEINKDDTKLILETIRNHFLPNKVTLLNPLNKDFPMLGNKATAYVCSDFSCKKPTNDVKELLELFS